MLSMVSLGGITLGRIAVVKSDVQRAADAGTLAALQVIRERGLPFDATSRLAAESIAVANSPTGIALTWDVRESATSVDITAIASTQIDTPVLVWTGGTTEIRAKSTSSLPQIRFDSVERRLPKLTLVLDYSGSMNLPFSGGNTRAIDVLEDSVDLLLNAGLEIDYGAAFYSDNVFKTVPIGNGAPNGIVSAMNQYDAGGSTNTAAGLSSAQNLLSAVPDTGRYVLLVSDGEPNSFDQGKAAANALWDAGMTIFSLEIRRSGSGPALDQFMTDVAGTPSSRRDRNYHFVATTASDLVNEFRRIVSTIVCKVGPLNPAPADPALLRVFLRQGGVERTLPLTDDLGRDTTLERYLYDTGDQSIKLTATACDAVMNGATLVTRAVPPSMVD
ncbi:MAG: vWA domain-containing protein [Kofleriaceae bacterium]|nr:vWA domain-containing protein [Kofleriaceae bacterium]